MQCQDVLSPGIDGRATVSVSLRKFLWVIEVRLQIKTKFLIYLIETIWCLDNVSYEYKSELLAFQLQTPTKFELYWTKICYLDILFKRKCLLLLDVYGEPRRFLRFRYIKV